MTGILVTGATGYLGSKIVLHLRDQGYFVYALCRSKPKNLLEKFSRIEIIEGDITNAETLELLKSKPINSIVHTVSLDHNLSEISPIEEVDKINILATWQLLDLFTKLKVEKFIYLSTMQVLGKLPPEKVYENHTKSPSNIYGLTHSIGEEIVSYYNQKVSTHCLSIRLSNGYGVPVFNENNCWRLVINDLCKSAYYDKRIVLSSDGTPTRDFIHIDDISKAIGAVLKKTSKDETIIHISSGETQSLLQLAHRVKSVFEKRYRKPIQVYHSGLVLSDKLPESLITYTLQPLKLLKTGFIPDISLEKGIEELFIYFENLNNTYA